MNEKLFHRQAPIISIIEDQRVNKDRPPNWGNEVDLMSNPILPLGNYSHKTYHQNTNNATKASKWIDQVDFISTPDLPPGCYVNEEAENQIDNESNEEDVQEIPITKESSVPTYTSMRKFSTVLVQQSPPIQASMNNQPRLTSEFPLSNLIQREYLPFGNIGLRCRQILTSTKSDDRIFVEIWPDEEVKKEESSFYAGKLNRLAIDDIRNELHGLCHKSFPNRLSILCNHIINVRGWQLHQKFLGGSVFGETPLHIAIMAVSEVNSLILINYGGRELILKPYIHEQYEGITCLHLAIVQNMRKLINFIFESLNGTDRDLLLHFEANCDFFKKKLKASSLPLTLAAWSGHTDIMDDLLEYGAQPDMVETLTNNNFLHSLVEFSYVCKRDLFIKVFKHIIETSALNKWVRNRLNKKDNIVNMAELTEMKKYLLEQKNSHGHTVLQQACYVGETKIILYILNIPNIHSFAQWEYGPVSFKYYDVTTLSSKDIDKNSISGLELLSSSINEENMTALVSEPLRTLIDVKWEQYLPWIYIFGFLHLIVMCVLTYFAVLKSKNRTTVLICSIIIFIYSLLIILQDSYVAVKSFIEKCKHGTKQWDLSNICRKYLKISDFHHGNIIFNFEFLRLVFAVTCMCWFISSYIAESSNSGFLAIAAVSGWYYCMSFTRGFKNFGYFTAMMHIMLFGNLCHFSVVYMILLFGFGTGFSCIADEVTQPETIYTLGGAFFSLTRLTLGLTDIGEDLDQTHSPTLSKAMFFVFLILSVVLLLNIVIAAMSDKYVELSGKKEVFWYKLSLNMIATLERGLPSIITSKANLKRYEVRATNANNKVILLLDVKDSECKKIHFK